MWEVYKNTVAFALVPIIGVVAFLYSVEAPIGRIEEFIRSHSGMIVSLGTLLLISALAFLTSHISNQAADRREALSTEAADRREAEVAKASDRREAFSRKVEAELQIARFRQAWIDEMRDDIALLLRERLYQAGEADKKDLLQSLQIHMKIELRLNHDEALAKRLSEALAKLHRIEPNDAEHSTALAEAILSSRNFLKNEWERLKTDVLEAQLLEREKK
ncbi:MAG: hypothetical protein OQK00_06925 [Rhodobacteraceae bacterium]|nr:hypothetical protein [Paracoccaceae bacterium]